METKITEPAAEKVVASKPTSKKARTRVGARTAPANGGSAKTSVMAAAEALADKAKTIAREAEKLSGPLRRKYEAKGNEIESLNSDIASANKRIEKLEEERRELREEIKTAEAGAMAKISSMAAQ